MLMPKDLLHDLEKGDRTMEMLKRETEPSQDLPDALRAGGLLQNAMQQNPYMQMQYQQQYEQRQRQHQEMWFVTQKFSTGGLI